MEDKKWYSGKYDRVFKEVMLNENNRDILKMLLEKILDIDIYDIELLNVESIIGNIHVKGKRLDLNLKTNIGKINVEVNSTNKDYVHSKNFSYLADLYSHDIQVGEVYNYHTKYIQINLSYELSKKIKPISIYKVMDEDKNTYVDNFIIYDVNMEYYKELWYTKDIKKVKDNILLVMLGLDKKDLIELSKTDKVVSKYMEEVERVNENPEFREYISYEEEQRKIRNEFKREGYESGFEDGINKGIEQGIEKGIEKGAEQKEISIVKNLLASGMEVEKISRITEIPEDKIREMEDTN